MKGTPNFQLFTLIKFLDEKDVSKVLSGSLKMGSVERYRNEFEREEYLEYLRGDRDEFCSNSYAVSSKIDIVVTHEGSPIGRVKGGVKDRLCLDSRSYVFSMSAITNLLFARNGAWFFDQKVRKLGDQAILVTNPDEFMRRIDVAIQREQFLQAYPSTRGQASGLVEYINFDKHNGPVGPFRKSKSYGYQKEWRLALIDSREELKTYPDNRFLEVGDIRDITFVDRTEALIKKGFTLKTLRPLGG